MIQNHLPTAELQAIDAAHHMHPFTQGSGLAAKGARVITKAKGVFLTVPRAEIDWRPLAWANNRLDIRSLVVRRGELKRLPELNPGDPDSPMLPGFDIEIGQQIVEQDLLLRIDPLPGN